MDSLRAFLGRVRHYARAKCGELHQQWHEPWLSPRHGWRVGDSDPSLSVSGSFRGGGHGFAYGIANGVFRREALWGWIFDLSGRARIVDGGQTGGDKAHAGGVCILARLRYSDDQPKIRGRLSCRVQPVRSARGADLGPDAGDRSHSAGAHHVQLYRLYRARCRAGARRLGGSVQCVVPAGDGDFLHFLWCATGCIDDTGGAGLKCR